MTAPALATPAPFSPDERTGKTLLNATRPYVEQTHRRSWAPSIPFYRASFRSNLWDERAMRLISYREAARLT